MQRSSRNVICAAKPSNFNLNGFVRCVLAILFAVLLSESPARAASEQKEDPRVEKLNTEVVRLHREGKTQDALKMAYRALKDSEKRYGRTDKRLSTSLKNLGFLRRLEGQFADAERYYIRNVSLFELKAGEKPESESDTPAPALTELADFYTKTGRHADAETSLTRALTVLEQAFGPNAWQLGDTLVALSEVEETLQKLASAEAQLQRAVKVEAETYPTPWRMMRYLDALASYYGRQNRWAAAETQYRLILSLRDGTEYLNANTDSESYAGVLASLAQTLREQRRYQDVIAPMTTNVALLEKAFGAGDQKTISAREYLASDLDFAEDMLGSIAQFRILKQHFESQDPPDTVNLSRILRRLSSQVRQAGSLEEATDLAKRSLALAEADSPGSEAVADALEQLIDAYDQANRMSEAEGLALRRLAVLEKLYGPNSRQLCDVLDDTASILNDIDYESRAETMVRRGLSICDVPGRTDLPDVQGLLETLATILRDQEKYAEAIVPRQRALDLANALYGPESLFVAVAANNLALDFEKLSRFEDAVPLYQKSIAIKEKRLGPNHIEVAAGFHNLAVIERYLKDYDSALPLHERAVKIWSEELGPAHLNTRTGLNEWAKSYREAGRFSDALAIGERIMTIFESDEVRRSRASETDQARRHQDQLYLSASRAYSFIDDAFTAWQNGAAAEAHATGISFWMAQSGLSSEASGALAQAAARMSRPASNGVLRERQDVSKDWSAAREKLIAEFAKAPGDRDAAAETALHATLQQLETRLDQLDRDVDREFPGFFTLTAPYPVKIAGAQSVLGPDEALLQFLVTETQSYVWAMTSTEVRWKKIALTASNVTDQVMRLRCGLDKSAWNGDGAQRCATLTGRAPDLQRPVPLPFDTVTANVLFKTLFADLDGLIKDKHLLIVPSGALSSLPFHVLVTEPVNESFKQSFAANNYVNVPWLARRNPITVLPSVASLTSLRKNAKISAAHEPFIGFGNPVLTGHANCKPVKMPEECPDAGISVADAGGATRGSEDDIGDAAGFFRDGLADLTKIKTSLCPLPDTAYELKCVARSVGAPDTSIFLGPAMTETAVKTADLAGYKVIHFATHGLLAGETESLAAAKAEPSLVMTPPGVPTEDDDGLLTASEITGLKLDADWVVMSACNTASGGTPGSEALSGLARAFFYAGTRTLLVSHWPVSSYAATMLTSHTFAELKTRPGLGRSEALRRAMVQLMSDRDRPGAAHPGLWAPFVVVGEGRAAN